MQSEAAWPGMSHGHANVLCCENCYFYPSFLLSGIHVERALIKKKQNCKILISSFCFSLDFAGLSVRVCTLKWSLLLVCISASIARSLISAPNKEGASILLRMAFTSTKSHAMTIRVRLIKQENILI